MQQQKMTVIWSWGMDYPLSINPSIANLQERHLVDQAWISLPRDYAFVYRYACILCWLENWFLVGRIYIDLVLFIPPYRFFSKSLGHCWWKVHYKTGIAHYRVFLQPTFPISVFIYFFFIILVALCLEIDLEECVLCLCFRDILIGHKWNDKHY